MADIAAFAARVGEAGRRRWRAVVSAWGWSATAIARTIAAWRVLDLRTLGCGAVAPVSGDAPRGRGGASVATATWVSGALRCVAEGGGDAPSPGYLRHALTLREVVVRDARLASDDEVAAALVADARGDGGGDAMRLGDLYDVALTLAAEPGWHRTSLVGAVVLEPRSRVLAAGDRRSYTELSGRVCGTLVSSRADRAGMRSVTAVIGARVGAIAPEPASMSGTSIDFSPPPDLERAPPPLALVFAGCLVAPLGCLALPLGALGVLGLALNDGAFGVPGPALGLLGALALLALWRLAAVLDRRGHSFGGAIGLLIAGVGALAALVSVESTLESSLHGRCAALGADALVALGVAIAALVFARSRPARLALAGLLALLLVELAWTGDGCRAGVVRQAHHWIDAATTRDAGAEAAARRLRGSGGGRLSIDDALDRRWPRHGLCGRTIHFSSALLFASDDATLSRAAATQLGKLATLLRRHPDAGLSIIGYADDRGSDAHNLALSLLRARAVATWLGQDRAIASERVEVLGRGAAQPLIAPAKTDAERAINRRVEVVLRCGESAMSAKIEAAP